MCCVSHNGDRIRNIPSDELKNHEHEADSCDHIKLTQNLLGLFKLVLKFNICGQDAINLLLLSPWTDNGEFIFLFMTSIT